MRAVRIEQPGVLQIVDLPKPEPAPGEALVAVAFSGICGSDLDIFTGQRPADFVQYPVIPGHEWSGTIAAVGELVDPSLVGKKVAGEGFSSCQRCGPCERGDTVLCETRYDETGFTRPGAWADFLAIRAEQLHLLDDAADLRAAACLEPAACAADAVTRAAVLRGETVAVVGAGTVGALVVQFLRGLEPSELTVMEPDERAARMALECGATATCAPVSAAELAGRFDVVIETAGAASTAQASLDLVRRGGRVVLVGIPEAGERLGVASLVSKRVEIQTVFGAPRIAWKAAVDAFTGGQLNLGILVTREFDLSEAGRALNLLQNSSSVGKILLRP
ncbi:MAG: zinc-binding dehydrogenase [Dehalococcoidia bacterium]